MRLAPNKLVTLKVDQFSVSEFEINIILVPGLMRWRKTRRPAAFRGAILHDSV